MKQNKVKNNSRILIVVSIALVFLILFVVAKPYQQSLETASTSITSSPPTAFFELVTLTPIPPDYLTNIALTYTAMPTIPATATSTLAPPACTFPLTETTTEESIPQEYIFSEPQVMLNAVQGNYYNIVEWLPNSQQVLMTQDLYNISKSEGDKILRQSIELYNLESNVSQIYAIRHYIDEPPVWQPKLNAIIYPAMNLLGIDENTHQLNFTRQVWVSYGRQDSAQILADNLLQYFLTIKSDGSEMIYLSDEKIFKKDGLLKDIASIPFDLTQWNYRQSSSDEFPISYEMKWQPDTNLIFLHSNGGMQMGGGYTYILDANTGNICELNLDGWAVKAQWSSDGRYLAIIRAAISSSPVDVTDLAVLDTATGKLYTTIVVPQGTEGKHYVKDFVWAPDNHHLLALGSIPSQITIQGETIHHELYLVDFTSAQSIHLFPEFKSFFANGVPKNNFAWSSDGLNLLVRCPTNVIDRICIISVQKAIQ